MGKLTIERETSQGVLRGLKQPLYDTMEIPADANAVPSIDFFTRPIGDDLNVSGNSKTELDTNMSSSGELGTPEQFELFGFNVAVMYGSAYKEVDDTYGALADFLDDMAEIYEQGVFEFLQNSKSYLEIPLTQIPHGNFHLHTPADTGSDAAAAAGVNFFMISNGDPEKKEFYKFYVNDAPEFIPSNQNFRCKLRYPNGDIGLSASGTSDADDVYTRVVVYMVGVQYASL